MTTLMADSFSARMRYTPGAYHKRPRAERGYLHQVNLYSVYIARTSVIAINEIQGDPDREAPTAATGCPHNCAGTVDQFRGIP